MLTNVVQLCLHLTFGFKASVSYRVVFYTSPKTPIFRVVSGGKNNDWSFLRFLTQPQLCLGLSHLETNHIQSVLLGQF